MPEPTGLRYRIVSYELDGENETAVLDTIGRAFIAVTGTLHEDGSVRLGAYRSRQPDQRPPEQPMSQHSPASNVIVQIKIKLLGVRKPPVWRRVQLRADTRLDHLHEILQAALGWENYHLHAFSFGEEEFGPRDPELGLDFNDERQVTLGELTDIDARFRYTYDFGDNWEHEILVEDLLDPEPDTHYPTLVAAKGACPPEDCGGTWGYADLKAILANPNDEQHQEMLEWLGLEKATEFDPATAPSENIDYELALTGASR